MKKMWVVLLCAAAGAQQSDYGWLDAAGKLSVALPRIDAARREAGAVKPVASDYDIGMWHYPGWFSGTRNWQLLAAATPWRMPLLYDSSDEAARASGIQYYSDSNPRVMDWHVKWMAEHAVNWIVFDWYPRFTADKKLDPTSPNNSAIDVAFLGKSAVGGPPVAGNRFEKTMRFAVMWTNHEPFDQLASDLGDYLANHYFRQPNYFRVDGKPLLPVWSLSTLTKKAGSTEAARQYLQGLREAARKAGVGEIFIAAVCQPYPGPVFGVEKSVRTLGFDGAMGYWAFGTHWDTQKKTPVQFGGKKITVYAEDYATETVPGLERGWEAWRQALGRDYLVGSTAMQDWRGLARERVILLDKPSAPAFEDMLRRARGHIDRNGLRKIVTVEAWNEWAEGSYVEPSVEYGFGFLEAIRRVFAR